MINFDFPASIDQYMHRVGRTARAGSAGKAVSLAMDGDYKMLKVEGWLWETTGERVRE